MPRFDSLELCSQQRLILRKCFGNEDGERQHVWSAFLLKSRATSSSNIKHCSALLHGIKGTSMLFRLPNEGGGNNKIAAWVVSRPIIASRHLATLAWDPPASLQEGSNHSYGLQGLQD